MNFYEIIVIGGGAAGLMAAYASAKKAREKESGVPTRKIRVAVLEKMPRPGRKLMLTGKGRCNLTNVKAWEDFQTRVHPNPRPLRPAFYQLPPEKLLRLMAQEGLETVVERGDRAFPASHRAVDVVDTLQRMARNQGAMIFCGKEVSGIQRLSEATESEARFEIRCSDGSQWQCNRLVLATGGLAYPMTGSSGDGLRWAEALGLTVKPTFPSLTALVPKGYKNVPGNSGTGCVIERDTPLSEVGEWFRGLSLKNVGLTLYIDNTRVREEVGDLDFTDGGLEGPLGFRFSRQCVHAMRNGSRVQMVIDLKPGVDEDKLAREQKTLAEQLPGNIARALLATAGLPNLPKGLTGAQQRAYLLKHWTLPIVGYVGYERSVVTAGGVSTDEISPKTMETRNIPGLYLAGELLDLDADTGGYNLQIAFCTGFLAGQSAAQALLKETIE